MALNIGEEFKSVATPGPDLWRKLAYLAAVDSDSVLTGSVISPRRFAAGGSDREDQDFWRAAQLLSIEEQRRQAQIQLLDARLDVLDKESLRALREAEKHLEEIRRNANRTIDGRLVFMDKDSTLRDQHGAAVENVQVDWDQWDPAADSWETYQDIQDDYRQAREFHDQVQEQKERLANGDLSDEELDALEKDLTALEEAAPQSPEPAERSTSAAKSYSGDAKLGTAKSIGPVFASAGQPDTAVPDTEPEPQLNPGTVPLSP